MAQRTVHYTFGALLGEACSVADLPRFLFGSLLPDALVDRAERDLSHFAFTGADGTRFYDFERFRREFADRMDDPLYLGYYLHLVEDNFYREYCHKLHHLYFTREEDVRQVHRDYHLLNPHLVEKYCLVNRLELPADFAAEPVARAAHFDPERLALDLRQDFAEHPTGDYRFFSAAMMDEYIDHCLPAVDRELRAVLRGDSWLCAADFAWKNPI